MTISVVNWDERQHFKDREPIWIKLYRRLRHKREWRQLSGDAAKLLIDVWMLAAEQPTPGEIDLELDDIAWELRASPAALPPLLAELEEQGFIVMISSRYQADIPRALARDREETETEKKTTAAAPPEGVEKLHDIAEELLAAPAPPAPTRQLTTAELVRVATERLGLGVADPANRRLITQWEGRGKSLDEIEAALLGLADMRDRDLVGWDSIRPGQPVSCRALEHTHTLADQGDGRALRVLWDVAVEHWHRQAGLAVDAPRHGLRRLTV